VRRRGFTLLETLLALMVFSVAVVALVEAVHQLGELTLLRRHEGTVQERIRSLLVEYTRMPMPVPLADVQLKEDDVTYTVSFKPLEELKNRDGQPVEGLFEVRVNAAWLEGRVLQQTSSEMWVFPPLFQP